MAGSDDAIKCIQWDGSALGEVNPRVVIMHAKCINKKQKKGKVNIFLVIVMIVCD